MYINLISMWAKDSQVNFSQICLSLLLWRLGTDRFFVRNRFCIFLEFSSCAFYLVLSFLSRSVFGIVVLFGWSIGLFSISGSLFLSKIWFFELWFVFLEAGFRAKDESFLWDIRFLALSSSVLPHIQSLSFSFSSILVSRTFFFLSSFLFRQYSHCFQCWWWQLCT